MSANAPGSPEYKYGSVSLPFDVMNRVPNLISTLSGLKRNPYTELMFTSCTPVAVADGIIDLAIFNVNRTVMMVNMIFRYLMALLPVDFSFIIYGVSFVIALHIVSPQLSVKYGSEYHTKLSEVSHPQNPRVTS